jgi:hypothetical protein
LAADGEFTEEAANVRPAIGGAWRTARVAPSDRRSRIGTAAVVLGIHLLLLAMLRVTMVPKLPGFGPLPRVEVSFIPESAPVPAVAPPTPASSPSERTGHKVEARGPAPRTTPASVAANEPPSMPRLYRPDGGLALSDGLLDRLDAGADSGVEFRIAHLEKAGLFLRKPPIDYTPTRFDGFWVPSETLLQEWVRKGIQEVTIPIPGSSWRIVCKVSLLAPGGACGILPVSQGTNPIERAPYVPPPNRNR